MGTENITTIINNVERTNNEVINIPVTIDENNVINGAREILKVIRPTWNSDSTKFKLFTDGITNKLVGCFHNNPATSLDSANSTSIDDSVQINKDQDDVVLVRVYGNKTDLLIDRKAETKNIKLLHSHGFAPCLYAVFCNGLAYEYVPGVTLTPETVVKPTIWKLIACHMAEMHKVRYCDTQVNDEPLKPMLWKKVQQFLDLLPDKFSDPIKHERIAKLFLPIQRLRDEFATLYKILENLNSPVVFSHNDLLLGNVIYTESLNRITFIDYEYAGYNYQAYDIGNHFTEFAGIDEIDYSRYPSKEFQYEWLRCYLSTYKGPDSTVEDEDVHVLYKQVNKFALASHFLWAIWALIQVEYSTIDFDFVLFAHTRYLEYLTKKELFLSL